MNDLNSIISVIKYWKRTNNNTVTYQHYTVQYITSHHITSHHITSHHITSHHTLIHNDIHPSPSPLLLSFLPSFLHSLTLFNSFDSSFWSIVPWRWSSTSSTSTITIIITVRSTSRSRSTMLVPQGDWILGPYSTTTATTWTENRVILFTCFHGNGNGSVSVVLRDV